MLNGESRGSARLIDKEKGMEQNRYSYIKKIGRNTYSVVVRQAESATEKVENKIRRLLVNDLSKEL